MERVCLGLGNLGGTRLGASKRVGAYVSRAPDIGWSGTRREQPVGEDCLVCPPKVLPAPGRSRMGIELAVSECHDPADGGAFA